MRTDGPATSLTQRWAKITDVAIRGLHYTYASGDVPLPHTVRCVGDRRDRRGHNPRYALIALIGLSRNSNSRAAEQDLISTIWSRLHVAIPVSQLTPGDFGLGLWACAVDAPHSGQLHSFFSPAAALAQLRSSGADCDSVELSWLLLGACHALQSPTKQKTAAQELAERSLGLLLELHNPPTGLFWRHRRTGALAAVSRRIPCFANQIYPLTALAVAARVLSSDPAAALTADLARRLRRTQGPQGQWWWLYDAHSGQIVEEYPVFSVHQDGMAPMALLEAQQSTGVNHAEAVARGLNWIDGDNELRTELISTAHGLIFRDIHLHGVGRVRRMIRGLRHFSGVESGKTAENGNLRFTLNRECRPYHLGWALTAAELWCCQTAPPRMAEHQVKRSSVVVNAPNSINHLEPLHALDRTESEELF